MVKGLGANGVTLEEGPDWFAVQGMGPGGVPGGGVAETFLDHRIAMSMLICGMAAQKPVTVDDAGPIATSFPIFSDLFTSLGARLGEA